QPLVEASRRFERAAPVEDVAALEVRARSGHLPPERPVAERRVVALARASLHHAQPLVALERVEPGREPAGFGLAVVVDERDEMGTARTPSRVASRRRTASGLDEVP